MSDDAVWNRVDEELRRRKSARRLPGTWADLGRQIDASAQRLTNWKRRGVPPKDYPAIADALGWSVDQLLGTEGDRALPRDVAAHEMPPAPQPQIFSPAPPGAVELRPAREVPIVGTTQAGPPDRIWEHLDQVESEQYVEVATRDPYAYGLRVEGDSMSPRIMEGDWVVVEPSTEPLPGDEVVVKLKNGDVMVKKFTARHGDTVILDSINPSFARIARHAGDIDYMHYVGPRLPPRSVRTRVKL